MAGEKEVHIIGWVTIFGRKGDRPERFFASCERFLVPMRERGYKLQTTHYSYPSIKPFQLKYGVAFSLRASPSNAFEAREIFRAAVGEVLRETRLERYTVKVEFSKK